jgi:hypothetical protein
MDMSLGRTQIQPRCYGIESQCLSYSAHTLVTLLPALNEHFFLCVYPELHLNANDLHVSLHINITKVEIMDTNIAGYLTGI